MGDQRKDGILWTDETWNPIRGCSKVSSGCANCYAEAMASRFCGPGLPYEGIAHEGRWTGVVKLVPERLEDPIRWKRPRKIFVNSMSDLFHESLDETAILAVFDVIRRCATLHGHTFQILTKRAKRMTDLMTRLRFDSAGEGRIWFADEADGPGFRLSPALKNLQMGVSTEHQDAANERVPYLLLAPVATRFISAEPLLGHITLGHLLGLGGGLHQVVVGGESDTHARPMDPRWVRDLRDECEVLGVPFMFKQWGAWAPALEARDQWGMTLPAGTASNWGSWRPDGSWAPGVLSAKDGHTGMARFPGKTAGRILDGTTHAVLADA